MFYLHINYAFEQILSSQIFFIDLYHTEKLTASLLLLYFFALCEFESIHMLNMYGSLFFFLLKTCNVGSLIESHHYSFNTWSKNS